MSARVVQRYVLDRIDHPDLRLYTVWGPMLGDETREDARPATVHLSGERVTHFWTGGHGLADALAPVLGLPEGERAWDTFLLYGPGAVWEEGEAPPDPDFVMHVGKSLPEELRMNGEVLADEARRLLANDRAGPRESR